MLNCICFWSSHIRALACSEPVANYSPKEFAWSESYPNPPELESLEWDLGIQNFSDHLLLFLGKSKFHNHYLELTKIRIFSPALDWASYNSSGNLIYKPRGLFIPSFNSPYLSSMISCLLVHLLSHIIWHGILCLASIFAHYSADLPLDG